jgi:hypothetical protein
MVELQDRIKSQFTVVYLTLISVIQGCVLGYLFTVADPLLSNLTPRIGLLLFVSFVLIALVWNEYMMWSSMVRWVPRLPDSFLPLLMGAFQFWMIRSIPARSPVYFVALAAFLAASWVKYRHAYVVGRHEPENVAILESLRAWNRTTEWMLATGTVAALLAAWLDARFDAGSGSWPWAAAAVSLIPCIYVVRTVLFWRFVCPVNPGGAST